MFAECNYDSLVKRLSWWAVRRFPPNLPRPRQVQAFHH